MKVTRIVCNYCNKEIHRKIERPEDLSSYRDLVEYQLCRRCSDNPEAQLLNALIGGS